MADTCDKYCLHFKMSVDIKKTDGSTLVPFFDGPMELNFHGMAYEDVLLFEQALGGVFKTLNDAGWAKVKAPAEARAK